MGRGASKFTALATGIAVVFPSLAMKYFQTQSIVAVIWLAYVVSIFVFVFGPQRWDTYRWVPIEQTHIIIGRIIMWMLGGLLSVAVLERLNAI